MSLPLTINTIIAPIYKNKKEKKSFNDIFIFIYNLKYKTYEN